MLSLTRKPGERIRIGEDVTVDVVRIDRGQVVVKVEAPSDKRISRESTPKERHA